MRAFLVDFGSTFIKYAVYDPDLRACSFSGRESFPQPSICDGVRFEVPEAAIRQLTLSVLEQAMEHKCRRVYVSVQMHGYFIRDLQGNMSSYISWRDHSGKTEVVTENLSDRGTSLKANLPFVKLYGIDHRGEELFTLGSYIVWLLTGKNITHKTDACASGFFDAATLAAHSLPGLKLPEVTHQVALVGKWNGIDIYTPMGDHQVSYLGSGAAHGEYLINIGTATQISCLEQERSLIPGTEARPYIFEGWLSTVTGLTGGAALYEGGDTAALCRQLLAAIKLLPERKAAVIGGGGGDAVYETIRDALQQNGITCRQATQNIGLEGLKAMADTKIMKVGTMLSEVPFTNFPIIAKNTGLDFVIIDFEHGAFEYHILGELITKAKLVGLQTVIRLGDNRREVITKLADMGATGFLLPMTGTPGDIRQVVEYAKYSPVGKRGISTTRAHTLYDPPKLSEYMQQANSQMKVYAQLETAEGIRNAEEILKETGVDGVFIGPNDLSDDLGCIGDNAPVMECITQVAKTAQYAGKPWGIITANQVLLDHATGCGVDMVSCGSELNMLISGCKNIVKKFK